MSFQTIAGISDGIFWWIPALSEDQEKIGRIHQKYLVALTKFVLITAFDILLFPPSPFSCKILHVM